MERNISLARGFHKGGITPMDFKKKWNDIAPQINSKGPPFREGCGWQKVWNDLKFKVKKKLLHNKKEIRATGGGSNKQFILSPLEETVSNIICLDAVINPIGVAQGISTSTTQNIAPQQETVPTDLSTTTSPNTFETLEIDFNLPEIHEICHNEDDIICNELPTPHKRTLKTNENENERHKLLKVQTEVQQNLYEEVKKSLNKIEVSLKENQIINRENQRINRKRKERLALYKSELENKKKQRFEENKFKLMDFEIKQKKIEIEERKLALLELNKENN